jgi:hypothetical protein
VPVVRRSLAALLVALAILTGSAVADTVLEWNTHLLNSIKATSTPPPLASRAMAMVSIAVYDAVNSIEQTHRPYHFFSVSGPTTSRDAAAAQAAHDVLVGLFPARAIALDAALTATLAAVPDSPGKSAGIGLGSAAAASIMSLRSGDNAALVVPYTPGSSPGQWRPTPPANAPALLPNWPLVTPFSMASGSQFRSAGPPSLDSAAYAAALNEVKEIGSATSAIRTAEQTDIARFWADGAGTQTPPGHWNRIAQTVATTTGMSLAEEARMFALVNVAQADAAIVAWDNKYASDFWRPVTAIRAADTDGNPLTAADSAWTPLLTTPNFPSYTSGHATFSGAASAVLAGILGTDNFWFTTDTEAAGIGNRSFASFSAAADEAAMSRLYGGIHFRFDNDDGLANGRALGQWVLANEFAPVPEPGAIVLVLTGILAALASRTGR